MASVPAAPAAQRGERRRPFVVREARILLAYRMLGALLAVYARETPQFRPREVRSIANSGMTSRSPGWDRRWWCEQAASTSPLVRWSP